MNLTVSKLIVVSIVAIFTINLSLAQNNLLTSPIYSSTPGNIYYKTLPPHGGLTSEEFKAISLLQKRKLTLIIDSIEINNYLSVINPEFDPSFKLELISCNSRDCFTIDFHDIYPQKTASTVVYKFSRPKGVIHPKQPALELCSWSGSATEPQFMDLLARAIEKGESDENYSIGFQLVEYNSVLPNEFISKKTWKLNEINTLKSLEFTLSDDNHSITVKARISSN